MPQLFTVGESTSILPLLTPERVPHTPSSSFEAGPGSIREVQMISWMWKVSKNIFRNVPGRASNLLATSGTQLYTVCEQGVIDISGTIFLQHLHLPRHCLG